MRSIRSPFLLAVLFLATNCSECKKIYDDGPDASGNDAAGTCSRNDQCPTGTFCNSGACRPPGSSGVGGDCTATRDCAAGLNCVETGSCAPAGTAVEGEVCDSAADCAAGLACIHDGFSGTCAQPGLIDLGGACTATSDCLGGLACGANDTCEPPATAYPPFAGVACDPDSTTTFTPFFDVPRATPIKDFYRLPFPNDVRVRADGTLDLTDFPRPGKSILGVDIIDLFADTLDEDFEGFSSVAPVTFRFSKELDFGSLGANGVNIQLVDVTMGTPEFGLGQGRSWSYDTGKHKYQCQHALVLGNNRAAPLLPGHTYAAYLLTAIRSATAQPPVVSTDLVAMLGAAAPADPVLAAAYAKHASFRAFLTSKAIDPATIANVAVFTVGDASARMRQLAAATEAAPAPVLSDLTLCDGTAVSPCAGDDGRACGDSSGTFWEIHGRFTEPNFQAGTAPYAAVADGGAIAYTGTTPTSQGTNTVCFAMTIPKTTMPVTGWPLVVHAHGTGGSFKAAITGGIADALATGSKPTATLTFDGIAHGERRHGSPRAVDSLVFNVVNPRAARDNHLQGGVDVISALRIAATAPATVGTATIDFDPAKTYYFGHSQGSNMGLVGVGVSARAQAALFSGAGSDLTIGILNKTSPSNAKAGLSYVAGEPIDGAGHPVMVLIQTYFDRIDPVNYAPLLVTRPPVGIASKHVMQTWSATDTYSPKDTLSATARSARLLLAAPMIEDIGTVDPRPITANRTGGDGQMRFATVFQYATDGTYDGHFVAENNTTARADWLAFFMSLATTGSPTVP